jgi:hypothetical protein
MRHFLAMLLHNTPNPPLDTLGYIPRPFQCQVAQPQQYPVPCEAGNCLFSHRKTPATAGTGPAGKDCLCNWRAGPARKRQRPPAVEGTGGRGGAEE